MTAQPTSKQLHLVQKNLARLHFYDGPIRVVLTVGIIKAIQRSLVARGYTGGETGAFNADTQKYMQLVGRKGGYTGAINSTLDAPSWAGYVKALGSNKLTHASTQLSFTNSALPAVTGTAKVGSVLTVSNGTFAPTPTSYRYQWLKAGVAISGATTSTYTPVSGDIGAVIASSVTAVKNGYDDLTKTSAATAAVVA